LAVTRQTGSHLRLTTVEHGEHHVTIPRHENLRIGTLAGVLGDVTQHFGLNREELVERLSRDDYPGWCQPAVSY
jgi:hypothetical protein